MRAYALQRTRPVTQSPPLLPPALALAESSARGRISIGPSRCERIWSLFEPMCHDSREPN
eukprot:5244102-Pleurochrysis_carterae.AAC.1